jgi:hypothetical protein
MPKPRVLNTSSLPNPTSRVRWAAESSLVAAMGTGGVCAFSRRTITPMSLAKPFHRGWDNGAAGLPQLRVAQVVPVDGVEGDDDVGARGRVRMAVGGRKDDARVDKDARAEPARAARAPAADQTALGELALFDLAATDDALQRADGALRVSRAAAILGSRRHERDAVGHVADLLRQQTVGELGIELFRLRAAVAAAGFSLSHDCLSFRGTHPG